MTTINSFTDDYDWLSNFYMVDVEYKGIIYPSTEHAYQAAKAINPKARMAIRNADDCMRAKRLGRKLTMRKDWEYIKQSVMLDILRKKFAIKELGDKLLATGDAKLEEGNTWGDVYWGTVNGKGKNWLGRILMTVRQELVDNKGLN